MKSAETAAEEAWTEAAEHRDVIGCSFYSLFYFFHRD